MREYIHKKSPMDTRVVSLIFSRLNKSRINIFLCVYLIIFCRCSAESLLRGVNVTKVHYLATHQFLYAPLDT